MSGDNTKHSVFKVDVSCSGCKNAIERILKKIQGVTKWEFDDEKMYVRVDHTDTVITQKIKKALKKWSDATDKEVALIIQEANSDTDAEEITDEDKYLSEVYHELKDIEKKLSDTIAENEEKTDFKYERDRLKKELQYKLSKVQELISTMDNPEKELNFETVQDKISIINMLRTTNQISTMDNMDGGKKRRKSRRRKRTRKRRKSRRKKRRRKKRTKRRRRR